MQPHLLLMLRENTPQHDSVLGTEGNLLLDRSVGAKIVVTPNVEYGYETKNTSIKSLKDMMFEYAEKLRSAGSNPYVIPLGGSNTVGTWGYIEAFQELVTQGVLENFDDIVVATGSGGTICGLAVGNYLTGMKVKLHAVCVSNSADYFYDVLDDLLGEYGLTDKDGKPLRARDLAHLTDDYKGIGYALSTEEELDG
jgi:1-aminocyclopropane-1-carboxylate deaminase/D-cysteine desulfhydrase-like pyridoxal-dependent ACC family enzyme